MFVNINQYLEYKYVTNWTELLLNNYIISSNIFSSQKYNFFLYIVSTITIYTFVVFLNTIKSFFYLICISNSYYYNMSFN